MPRPNRLDEQRKELLQIVTQVFCELGYRKTTTSILAKRCKVRENILYRLWSDKKNMFLAAINDLFEKKARHLFQETGFHKNGTPDHHRNHHTISSIGPLYDYRFPGASHTDGCSLPPSPGIFRWDNRFFDRYNFLQAPGQTRIPGQTLPAAGPAYQNEPDLFVE